MVVDAHGDELDEAFPGIDAGVQGLMAEVDEAFWASRRCRRSRMAVSAGPELGDLGDTETSTTSNWVCKMRYLQGRVN